MIDAGVPWRVHLLLAVAVVVVVGSITAALGRAHYREERNELSVIAEERGQMLEAWFSERVASASLSATSFPQAELYAAWRGGGDVHARDRLFRRLTQFAEAGGFSDVTLLDESGRLLWSSSNRAEHDVPLTGLAPWAGGAVPGTFGYAGTLRDPAGGLHVDFAAALPTAAPGGAPVVVYHAEPEDLLPERLSRWATHHASATVVVFRAVDDGVEGLAWPAGASVVQEQAEDGIGTWFLDDGAPHALATRLASGDIAALAPAEGRDHRGERVVGAGREIGDSGWYLLAQVDRGEIMRGVARGAQIGLLVALLAYLAGLHLLWRAYRAQRVAIASATEHADAERGRSERLLAAIADASPDAIFAKDLEGRYLFINRAGSDFVGRSFADVIGRTDRELFPKEQADDLRVAERELVAAGRLQTFEETVDTTQGRLVFSATKGLLRAADGRAYGTFGIARNVTDWRAAQRALEQQAHELAEHVEELERFNRVLVDRELVMVTLKRQLNAFALRLGEAEPFPGVDALHGDEASDD